MRFCRALPLAMAAVLLAASPPGAAGDDARTFDDNRPFELAALMQGMAASSGVVAQFREEKQMALLAVPLESSGVLYFAPPGRLARFTTEPAYSSLVIDGEQLRFREGESGEEFDLSGNPMARVFVDNFIVLFRGDLAGLQALYDTRLSGGADAWTLELVPKQAPLDRVMEKITLHGGAAGMNEMVMLAVDGDLTTTRLESVDADHAFSDAELETLFAERVPLGDPTADLVADE